MGWDASLTDPVTHETLETDTPHFIRGSTYAIDGTKELWLAITYNYSPIFRKYMGEDGLWQLNGMSGAKSIPLLEKAILQMGDDVDPDYWKATEGNAKEALYSLKALAEMRPDGIWEIT